VYNHGKAGYNLTVIKIDARTRLNRRIKAESGPQNLASMYLGGVSAMRGSQQAQKLAGPAMSLIAKIARPRDRKMGVLATKAEF
jgi:hypothetical protein